MGFNNSFFPAPRKTSFIGTSLLKKRIIMLVLRLWTQFSFLFDQGGVYLEYSIGTLAFPNRRAAE